MPLYLDKVRGECICIVRNWYPDALRCVWTPSIMDAAMDALRKKRNGCCSCHNIILQEVTTIAIKVGAVALHDWFSSQSDAKNYFINTSVDSFVTTTLHELRKHRKKSNHLKRKVPVARRSWIAKCDEWHQAEAYLGVQQFSYELR
jgi:hypothetical protein